MGRRYRVTHSLKGGARSGVRSGAYLCSLGLVFGLTHPVPPGTEVPNVSPSPCDIMDDCPDRNKSLLNCGPQPCPKGELCCLLDGLCIPTTWLCDGHRDCSDYSDELGCGVCLWGQGGLVSRAGCLTPSSV